MQLYIVDFVQQLHAADIERGKQVTRDFSLPTDDNQTTKSSIEVETYRLPAEGQGHAIVFDARDNQTCIELCFVQPIYRGLLKRPCPNTREHILARPRLQQTNIGPSALEQACRRNARRLAADNANLSAQSPHSSASSSVSP